MRWLGVRVFGCNREQSGAGGCNREQSGWMSASGHSRLHPATPERTRPHPLASDCTRPLPTAPERTRKQRLGGTPSPYLSRWFSMAASLLAALALPAGAGIITASGTSQAINVLPNATTLYSSWTALPINVLPDATTIYASGTSMPIRVTRPTTTYAPDAEGTSQPFSADARAGLMALPVSGMADLGWSTAWCPSAAQVMLLGQRDGGNGAWSVLKSGSGLFNSHLWDTSRVTPGVWTLGLAFLDAQGRVMGNGVLGPGYHAQVTVGTSAGLSAAVSPGTVTVYTAPGSAEISLSGTGLDRVTQITFNWTLPDNKGNRAAVWNKGTPRWGTGVLAQSAGMLRLFPQVTEAGDTSGGWTDAWSVTVRTADGQVCGPLPFTVVYAPNGTPPLPEGSATVTFNTQGGSPQPVPRTVEQGEPYGMYGVGVSSPAVARDGYAFQGWWTAASGGTQVTESMAVDTNALNNCTLHAQWTAADTPVTVYFYMCLNHEWLLNWAAYYDVTLGSEWLNPISASFTPCAQINGVVGQPFGTLPPPPASPHPNIAFAGWFADCDLTAPLTEHTLVQGGYRVAAKWEYVEDTAAAQGDLWWWDATEGVWKRAMDEGVKEQIAQVFGASSKVMVICHGWNSSFREDWVRNMAISAKHWEYHVLAVDWKEAAAKWFPSVYGNYNELANPITRAAAHIPQVAWTARGQLQTLNIAPGRLTLVGHSHGGHVLGTVAQQLGGVARFVGLDVSPVKYHQMAAEQLGVSWNSIYPYAWNGAAANAVEFYKTSWGASMGSYHPDSTVTPRDLPQVFGTPSFFVLHGENDFGSSGLMENTISRHGDAHSWFIRRLAADDYVSRGMKSTVNWEYVTGLYGVAAPSGGYAGVLRDNTMLYGGDLRQKIATQLGKTPQSIAWRYAEVVYQGGAPNNLDDLRQRVGTLTEFGIGSLTAPSVWQGTERVVINRQKAADGDAIRGSATPQVSGGLMLMDLKALRETGGAVNTLVTKLKSASGPVYLSGTEIKTLSDAVRYRKAIGGSYGANALGTFDSNVSVGRTLNDVNGGVRAWDIGYSPEWIYETGGEELLLVAAVGMDASAWEEGRLKVYDHDVCPDNNVMARIIRVQIPVLDVEVAVTTASDWWNEFQGMVGSWVGGYFPVTPPQMFLKPAMAPLAGPPTVAGTTFQAREDGTFAVRLEASASSESGAITNWLWTSEDAVMIIGEGSAAVVFGSLPAGEDGVFAASATYSVTVTVADEAGNVSSASHNFTIWRGAALSWAEGPESRTVLSWQTVTLTLVVESGAAIESYVWRRNGEVIENVSGTSYVTPVLMAADDGAVYSVTVTDADGFTSVLHATLTVVPRCTVTFDAVGGSDGTVSVIATNGLPMPTATAPVRASHIFNGYYDAQTGGTQYYTATMESARNWDKSVDTTLYAHWTAICAVTLDAQGGSGGTMSVIATNGLPMPTATAPARANHIFCGYYDAQTGGAQYYTATMDSARDWDKDGDATLYARWAVICTVTLDPNEGSGGTVSVTVANGLAMPTATAPALDGYVFAGYYDATTGGTQYYTAVMQSARNWDKNGDATLYARWRPTLATALDAVNLVWETSGAAAWFGQTDETFDNLHAARSGLIGHSQFTRLETTVTGPGTISFMARVSSEQNYDFLRFYIGTAMQVQISGTVPWTLYTYTVGAGTHTLRWEYIKDGSVSVGSDCAWVDQVVWAPVITETQTTPRPVPFVWLDKECPGHNGNYEALAHSLGVNGYTVWESYVAGLNPTNANSLFYASIAMAGSQPIITWHPNLGNARVYTLFGKPTLDAKGWAESDPNNIPPAMRFFKVRVDLPGYPIENDPAD